MVSKHTRQCTNEDVGPQKGVDCEIPHRLERGMSASEDAGSRRGVDREIPHRLERGTKQTFFIRVWKPLPWRRILKP